VSDDEKVMRVAAAIAQAYEFDGTVNKYDVQAAESFLASDILADMLDEAWGLGVDAAWNASQPFLRPMRSPYRKEST